MLLINQPFERLVTVNLLKRQTAKTRRKLFAKRKMSKKGKTKNNPKAEEEESESDTSQAGREFFSSLLQEQAAKEREIAKEDKKELIQMMQEMIQGLQQEIRTSNRAREEEQNAVFKSEFEKLEEKLDIRIQEEMQRFETMIG
ncbi:MAG: hypothetical protein ACK528_08840, partial [Alphaproteobacteria bacterium]